MTKYVILEPWHKIQPGTKSLGKNVSHSSVFSNPSSPANIKLITILGTDCDQLHISVIFSDKVARDGFLEDLDLLVKVSRNEEVDDDIFSVVIPKHLRYRELPQILTALHKLDPFDSHFIKVITGPFEGHFNFTNNHKHPDLVHIELQALIREKGIKKALYMVIKEQPKELYALGQAYLIILCNMKEELTINHFVPLFRCYDLIPENDVRFIAANYFIFDEIKDMGLDECIDSDTTIPLPKELKPLVTALAVAAMKLGYLDNLDDYMLPQMIHHVKELASNYRCQSPTFFNNFTGIAEEQNIKNKMV